MGDVERRSEANRRRTADRNKVLSCRPACCRSSTIFPKLASDINKRSPMNFIYDLHRSMLAHSLLLVYQGDFTQETTKSILTMAERSLEVTEEDAAIKRKVFNVMVEALQNIVKHNDSLWNDGKARQAAIFLIGRESQGYSIMSGNPVPKKKVPALRETLNRINTLDQEGLKDLY